MTVRSYSLGTRVLRWHDRVSQLGFWLGSTALGLIVAIYSFEVISRYFFGAPTRWASDFVSFLLLITVFLVAPWLTRGGGHVAVTVLQDQLPERSRQFLFRLGYLISAVACLCVGYILVQENILLFDRGSVTLTTVSIPKWPLSVLISYGMLNSGLYFLRLSAGDSTLSTGEGA